MTGPRTGEQAAIPGQRTKPVTKDDIADAAIAETIAQTRWESSFTAPFPAQHREYQALVEANARRVALCRQWLRRQPPAQPAETDTMF